MDGNNCQCTVIMWPENCVLINKLKGHLLLRACPCVCVDTFDSKRRNLKVWLL